MNQYFSKSASSLNGQVMVNNAKLESIFTAYNLLPEYGKSLVKGELDHFLDRLKFNYTEESKAECFRKINKKINSNQALSIARDKLLRKIVSLRFKAFDPEAIEFIRTIETRIYGDMNKDSYPDGLVLPQLYKEMEEVMYLDGNNMIRLLDMLYYGLGFKLDGMQSPLIKHKDGSYEFNAIDVLDIEKQPSENYDYYVRVISLVKTPNCKEIIGQPIDNKLTNIVTDIFTFDEMFQLIKSEILPGNDEVYKMFLDTLMERIETAWEQARQQANYRRMVMSN